MWNAISCQVAAALGSLGRLDCRLVRAGSAAGDLLEDLAEGPRSEVLDQLSGDSEIASDVIGRDSFEAFRRRIRLREELQLSRSSSVVGQLAPCLAWLACGSVSPSAGFPRRHMRVGPLTRGSS